MSRINFLPRQLHQHYLKKTPWPLLSGSSLMLKHAAYPQIHPSVHQSVFFQAQHATTFNQNTESYKYVKITRVLLRNKFNLIENTTIKVPCFFLQHVWNQTPFHVQDFLILVMREESICRKKIIFV